MSKKTENKKEKQITPLFLEFVNDEIPTQTINENQEIIKNINSHYSLWNELAIIIKETYKTNRGEYEGYDSPMQFLNAESFTTIDASSILAAHGYYRQAISLLRCWFENSLYGIYYNDHRVEFSQSYYDDEPSLNFKKDFMEYIFKFPNFKNFDKELAKRWNKNEKFKSFNKWMSGLYTELSAYIHGRGFWRSEILNIKLDEHPRKYNKESFEFWYDCYRNVFVIITISFLLYNPKLLNKYPSKRKKILIKLTPDCAEILVKTFGVKF